MVVSSAISLTLNSPPRIITAVQLDDWMLWVYEKFNSFFWERIIVRNLWTCLRSFEKIQTRNNDYPESIAQHSHRFPCLLISFIIYSPSISSFLPRTYPFHPSYLTPTNSQKGTVTWQWTGLLLVVLVLVPDIWWILPALLPCKIVSFCFSFLFNSQGTDYLGFVLVLGGCVWFFFWSDTVGGFCGRRSSL